MRNFILVAFIMTCLHSCAPDQGLLDNYEIGIREDINLSMFPALSPSGSQLDFIFKSIAANYCEGTGYQNKVQQNQNDISIHLIQLNVIEPCHQSVAAAEQQIAVTSQHGVYEISIDLGDLIHNAGLLTIDQRGFNLDLETEFGLHIVDKEMLRIPELSIWGYVYHPQKQSEAIHVIEHVLQPVSDNVNLEKGYYGHFRIDQNGDINIPLTKEFAAAFPFIYRFDGEHASLPDLVAEIKSLLPVGSEFRLLSWEGKVF